MQESESLNQYQEQLSIIESIFKDKNVLVAFSGGVDSSLVLLLSLKYAKSTIPVFFNGPIFANEEMEAASELCAALGVRLQVIEQNPLENPDFKKNPPNRCYICKKGIMSKLLEIRSELSYDIIVEGTNASDLSGHRPGYKALSELSIKSPLLEAHLSKQDIRNLIGLIAENLESFVDSKYISDELKPALLKTQISPPNPCLCSRFEFGLEITAPALKMVEQAEIYLKNLLNAPTLRVRIHKNNIARIEIDEKFFPKILSNSIYKEIGKKLKSLGFTYITLDLEGFRSGSGLEIIKK